MMLNSFGVGLDKGLQTLPNFARDAGVAVPLLATGPRPSAARVPPLPVAQWDKELAQKLGAAKSPPLNVQKTLANHPKLLGKWVLWANHVLFKNSNTPRVREIAILRAGWNSGSMYEWNQHVRVGRGVKMTDADFAAIGRGPADAYWDGKPAVERLALQAADELRTKCNVSDATWARLAAEGGLSDHQRMDLVAAVGQYSMVSIFLNTFGVELDKGMTPVPFR